jgi:hypothetical protein
VVLALNHREPYEEDKNDLDEQDPQIPVVEPNRHVHVNHHEEIHC